MNIISMFTGCFVELLVYLLLGFSFNVFQYVVRLGGKFIVLFFYKYLLMDVLRIKTYQEIGLIYTFVFVWMDWIDWIFIGQNSW